MFKSNEHSEYSYIGLGDFFSGKSLKFCSGSNLILLSLFCDFINSSGFPLLKRRQTPLSSSKSVSHEKHERLLISKKEKIIRFFREKRFYLLIQFSKIGLVSTKNVHFKLFYKFRKLRQAILFFDVQKLKVFEKKTSQFLFQFPCVLRSFPTVRWLCS